MKASELEFDELSESLAGQPSLAVLLSFVQVEYGLQELRSSWQGFVESSDFSGCTFSTKRDICIEFEKGLREFLEEPLLV